MTHNDYYKAKMAVESPPLWAWPAVIGVTTF